jgi:hypothetical protein
MLRHRDVASSQDVVVSTNFRSHPDWVVSASHTMLEDSHTIAAISMAVVRAESARSCNVDDASPARGAALKAPMRDMLQSVALGLCAVYSV